MSRSGPRISKFLSNFPREGPDNFGLPYERSDPRMSISPDPPAFGPSISDVFNPIFGFLDEKSTSGVSRSKSGPIALPPVSAFGFPLTGFVIPRDPSKSGPSKSNWAFPFPPRYGSSLSASPAHEKQLPRGFFLDGRFKSADGPWIFPFGPLKFPLGTSTSGPEIPACSLPLSFSKSRAFVSSPTLSIFTDPPGFETSNSGELNPISGLLADASTSGVFMSRSGPWISTFLSNFPREGPDNFGLPYERSGPRMSISPDPPAFGLSSSDDFNPIFGSLDEKSTSGV